MAKKRERVAEVASEAATVLHRIVANLVSQPDTVEIVTEDHQDGSTFSIRLASHDLQELVSSPRTIASLQCVIKALGNRSELKFELSGL